MHRPTAVRHTFKPEDLMFTATAQWKQRSELSALYKMDFYQLLHNKQVGSPLHKLFPFMV